MVDTIKLYSWNVNGLRAVLRKGELQKFLETEKPDVLCLQEIKCKPDQLDLFESDALKGYEVFWNPAKKPGYSGTAVLIKKAATILDQARTSEANVLSSEVPDVRGGLARDTRNDGLARRTDDKESFAVIAGLEGRIQILKLEKCILVNVYTPNSKPDLSRLKLRHDEWDPEFKNLLKELEKEKPVVTCGDFNCAHEEIDLARPKTNHHNAGFTDEEREGVTNLIDAGFVDTFRLKNPDIARYTWWSHWGKARENNVGWRIDYFFISKSLKKNLKDAEIYESQAGSDHCPISITLELE